MDIGAVLLLLAVITLVGLFLAQPFFEKQRKFSNTGAEHERSALLAERDRIVNALEELDFDHVLGKIPDEEYPVQRRELLQKGGKVLQQLNDGKELAEDHLEAVIASHRADGPLSSIDSDDELESLIASRRTKRNDKSAGFCAKCGKPVLRSDKFCPSCGKPVQI